MFRPYRPLTGPVQRTKEECPPEQIFFIFHGYGADGSNLLDIALDLSIDFPKAELYLPNAPYPCEANENGHQWFSLSDWSEKALLAEAEHVSESVEMFIRERTTVAQLDYKKVVLVGFSQGAMLAMHLAMTRINLCQAVVAYSGRLIDVPENLIDERVPMLLIHGDEDDVIQIDDMLKSYHTLRDLKYPVEGYRMTELGHSINQAGLELGKQFVMKHLNIGD